jgi:hypothetical protein
LTNSKIRKFSRSLKIPRNSTLTIEYGRRGKEGRVRA